MAPRFALKTEVVVSVVFYSAFINMPYSLLDIEAIHVHEANTSAIWYLNMNYFHTEYAKHTLF